MYKGKVYGIWAWTDVRGIWYWKDLLDKAGIEPNSLETWNGYLVAAKILQPPWLQRYAYLPTQNTIGSGPYSISLNQTIPYYDKMISMIPIGRARPSIPEYPQIAEHIQQAIHEVEHGIKNPAQAVNDAVLKSAKVLGWIEGSASTKSFAN